MEHNLENALLFIRDINELKKLKEHWSDNLTAADMTYLHKLFVLCNTADTELIEQVIENAIERQSKTTQPE